MENNNVVSIEKEQMETLVMCLNHLNSLGYTTQFKATPEGLLSLTTLRTFQPDQVKVVHFYRFEGESNPSDNAIAYAVQTNDGEKGSLVNGYGTSSDSLVNDFMQKVEHIHK